MPLFPRLQIRIWIFKIGYPREGEGEGISFTPYFFLVMPLFPPNLDIQHAVSGEGGGGDVTYDAFGVYLLNEILRASHLQFDDRTEEYVRGSFADDQNFSRRSILVERSLVYCVILLFLYIFLLFFITFYLFYTFLLRFTCFYFRGKGWRPEPLLAFYLFYFYIF